MTSPDSSESQPTEEWPYGLQSKEKFMECMLRPGNLEGYAETLRKVLNKPDVPPELLESVRLLLEKTETVRLVVGIQEKMAKIRQLLQSVLAAEEHERWKLVAQAQGLMEEITNEGLDLP